MYVYDDIEAWLCSSRTLGSREVIRNVEDTFQRAEKDLEYAKTMRRLAQQERMKVYSRNITYPMFTYSKDNLYRDSQKWLHMKKDPSVDKRRKYPERDMFNSLVYAVEKTVGRTVEITEICEYNFGEAWFIYFTLDDRKFVLEVPMVSQIKEESFEKYGGYCYMLRIGYCGTSYTTTIVWSGFDEEELPAAWDEIIAKCDKEDERRKK